MILKKVQRLAKQWKQLAAITVLVSFIAGGMLPAPQASAAATYSCGTYSSGAYSNNTSCNTSSGGSTTGNGGTVGAPNTGFAKLMEPANLAAVIGSLALVAAGVVVMLKSRNRKKHGRSFTDKS